MSAITYEVVEHIDAQELLDFYARQRHSTRAGGETLARMLQKSHCFVTAREGGKLIGVGRGVTDGVIGYLTECKLDPDAQGPAAITRQDGRIEHDERGIAREIAYRILGSLGYIHDTVDHRAKEYARGDVHVNSLEAFWARLKLSIRGTHVHVSRKHLPKYLGEFEYRFNMRKRPDQMFARLLRSF